MTKANLFVAIHFKQPTFYPSVRKLVIQNYPTIILLLTLQFLAIFKLFIFNILSSFFLLSFFVKPFLVFTFDFNIINTYLVAYKNIHNVLFLKLFKITLFFLFLFRCYQGKRDNWLVQKTSEVRKKLATDWSRLLLEKN